MPRSISNTNRNKISRIVNSSFTEQKRENTAAARDLRVCSAPSRATAAFAATARELGIPNAVVSKRIAILRSRHGRAAAAPDDAQRRADRQGETVLQWAQRILDDVDQLADAVSQTRTEPVGLLRICTSAGFGRNRVAPALSALAKRHPGLEISSNCSTGRST